MANSSRSARPAQPVTTELRLRNDLEIFPQRRRRQQIWVIKDPVALRYFQFREEEYAILTWLDGRHSLEQIKAKFDQRFAPLRMSIQQLHQFVVQLHRNGLAIACATGQGEQLLARHRRQRRRSLLSALTNPLAIRFRGFDPDPLLDWLMPRTRWLFSPLCLSFAVVLVFSVLLLVLSNWSQFHNRLPLLEEVIAPTNLLWLVLALALTKVLHEFGHALTCKHFGAECHEMGLMLLVFTPCLYCNVTDAWKLPSRWRRLAIGAAGIGVEIVLAAVCGLLWWYSKPGLMQAMTMNIMIVCSVGTVFLNGNPLLRYDGYYILIDLLDTPNLWQDSRAAVRRMASQFFWGSTVGQPAPRSVSSHWLLLYAASSMVYRALVLVSILYLFYRFLEPRGLLFLAHLATGLVVVGLVSAPLSSVWTIFSNPMLRRHIKPTRVAVTLALLSALAGCILWVPLPCRIRAAATIQPLDARRVYVSVPGRLIESVAAGDEVQAGDVLARLENMDLRRELRDVEGQLRQQETRVRSLESLRGRQSELGSQLPAAKEMLADLEKRQAQLNDDLASLQLIAPTSGIVLPPPPSRPTAQAGALPSWEGTPLDPENQGCGLDRKTLFCLIGEASAFEAVLRLDQSTANYVQVDQAVRLRLAAAPGMILKGTVTEISRSVAESQVNSPNSAGQTTAPTFETSREYQAQVRLEPVEIPLLFGMTGEAKIRVAPQTLSLRLYRMLSRNFKPLF